MVRIFLACAIAAAAAALTGCVPETPYRYSAFVPAARPIAWDGHTTEPGTLRIEGTVTSASPYENPAPQIHDSALFVPAWSVEGSAALAVARHVELGVRGTYASYDWASVTAAGTMPLPSAPPSWGWGPELRLSFPLDHDKHAYLGVAGNVMLYQVPYAEWTLTGPGSPNGMTVPCTPSTTCVYGYSLFAEKGESDLVYNVGVYPSYGFGHLNTYGHVFGVVDLTSGFKNDGFTDTPTNGSSVQGVGPIIVLGVGYGLEVDVLRLAALVYDPLTDSGSPVHYGPGFMLTVGVDAELWSPKGTPD